jgi:putative two-component system response regulator
MERPAATPAANVSQSDPQTILVVEDDESMRSLLTALLSREGYIVQAAHDGTSAIAQIASDPPDVILLDVVLPDCTGFDICRRLKRELATRLTPIILVTALSAREHRIEAMESGADEFLTKPPDRAELMARVRSLARMKRYTDDLDSAASIITTLAVMIEARDGYGDGHCYRMANYATALGRRMQLDSDDLQALHRGGFLHDIGMLAIPDQILRKSGALDPQEYELIKSHTIIGDSLCSNLRSLQAVRPIIRHHHERLDGSGYPDKLQGNDIPLVAQIMGVVDVFNAVTEQRPYQGTRSVTEGVEVLRGQVDRGWRRRDIVEEFAAMIENDHAHLPSLP